MAGKRGTKQPEADKLSGPTAAEADATPPVIRLPADCRMAAQASLKAQLEEALQQGEIVLDVEGLERVDTAALQLLVLFRRELESRGGKLGWRGSNDVLKEAVGLLGLNQLLTLPAATLA